MRNNALLLFCVTLSVLGCGRTDIKDYVPADEAAQRALTTALDAWKAGKTPDQIGATSPTINAQDPSWEAGKKLSAYEIVGSATGDDQNRRFTVKLTLDAATPPETTFVVFGKDPIWVMSADSYQRMSGM